MQQFLQIDPLTLPSLPLTERQKFPKIAAVYFAIGLSGAILYIGRSRNLATRWSVHHRYLELKTIGNVRIAWLHCSNESLLPDIEEALIKHFIPPLNRAPNQNRQLRQISEGREQLVEIIKTSRGSMSQRSFAKLLGVSTTAVQLWEKGDSVPDIENLAKIAARSGCKVDELVSRLIDKLVPYETVPEPLAQILKQIKIMPLSEVAIIVRAAADRLATAAESSGG